ncbi:chromosome segregation protein ScpA [Intrasporangium chromatireducens Q5-1]|uniref:Segregation and condensation protein A n=1 Tax=Intrasporangium chromatireducens Q5-1 TaxID=584657 RepID=W9GNT3_9MICO|nr:ScpA family protein [Intrasporangium chromatireducens]EWT06742.1 chromosome segregation protein ScpA [Intrasporangium chromatireducens Q5-1]
MSEPDLVDRPPVDAALVPPAPGLEPAPDAVAELGVPLPDGVPDSALGRGTDLTPGGVITRRAAAPFEVHLDVFQGPFDLLLGLIAKHKLDITEVALAKVTDEFVAHLKAAQADGAGDSWDLSQASEFVVVAATLLDLKAARLLPQVGPEDEEDLALIEARDLLFARLLQYRAYKDIARTFADRMATFGRITPRQAGLEPEFAALLPELVIAVTPEQFAMIAARALTPKTPPTVGLEHLHAPQVSVREQAAILVERLRARGQVSFRALVADADSTLVIVARFLALLELFKEAAIAFEQAEALGELDIRWTGADMGDVDITDEFDEQDDTDAAATPAVVAGAPAAGPDAAVAETQEGQDD